MGEVFPLEAVPESVRGSAPAARWRYLDGGGEIGVIPSVTHAFCDSCDRVRLTAEGSLRHCLFATRELDLRSLLRGGASDDDIAAVFERMASRSRRTVLHRYYAPFEIPRLRSG